MTRVRQVLEARWNTAKKPDEGWIFSSSTRSGHIEPTTLTRPHRNAITASKVRPFVLYTLRHAFLIRLGRLVATCGRWLGEEQEPKQEPQQLPANTEESAA